ncbi:hypothetical protein MHBO_003484 [Bonamia ostreae]|uniref:60S acidic ribosomal protein P2 n=1 Tax=Bonamia ostreae TaxID=126728 RepID=A0ABV2AR68_9EUKA
MKYLSAYLLSYINGNNNPGKDDIEKILKSVGIEPEAEKIALLLKSVEGKNLSEIIRAGLGKLGTASVAGGATAAAGDSKQKEEEKEEEKEESDNYGGMDLFDNEEYSDED